MDEDGESVEEDSSSDSDDEGDIPLFGRRKGGSVEEYEEEEPPTGTFRKGLGWVALQVWVRASKSGWYWPLAWH